MDNTDKEHATWPKPQFLFLVKWGVTEINFSEISGLDNETPIIEYRHGNKALPVKMPGLGKVMNISMKRGVFVGDNSYWDWYSKVKLNTIERIDITIHLLDENGHTSMTWILKNAWPTKITSTAMKSDDSSPAIDQIDIACESIVQKNLSLEDNRP